MQNFIIASNRQKKDEQEKVKQKKLEEFLTHKKKEKKFAKAIQFIENKNSLLTGDIEQLIEEELKPRKLTEEEKRLQRLKQELNEFQ